MQAVIDLGLRLARVDTTLLIQGESGVGKDVIA
jgi:DNA-binding NtrC family response regulator